MRNETIFRRLQHWCTTSCLLMMAVGFAAPHAHAQTQPEEQASRPAQVLDTPSYTIRIVVKCAEGEVSCDSVSYQGQSKRSNKSLLLSGRTAHRLCPDGVTPCRFLGYVFKNGAYTYSISDAGELVVEKGQKLILREPGTWQ